MLIVATLERRPDELTRRSRNQKGRCICAVHPRPSCSLQCAGGENRFLCLPSASTIIVRWGAGLGLRVDTPAGPLRLEYGYKLDRLSGESPGKLYLSFGVPF